MAIKVRKEIKVILARPRTLDLRDTKDFKAIKAIVVIKEIKVCQAQRPIKVHRDSKDFKDIKETKVLLLFLLDHKVRKEIKVDLELRERKDFKEIKVYREIKDIKDFKVLKALLEIKACKEVNRPSPGHKEEMVLPSDILRDQRLTTSPLFLLSSIARQRILP